MRERGSDCFENTRQATFVQQEYAVRNPLGNEGYGEHCWGITASDGPGWVKRAVNGVDREFYGLSPAGPRLAQMTAPSHHGSSSRRAFAPEIVIPTVRQFARLDLGMTAPYGFKPSFNQTFAVQDSPTGWSGSPAAGSKAEVVRVSGV